MIKSIFKDKEGKVKELAIFFLITIFIFLIPLGIHASENLTNTDEDSVFEQPLEEIIEDIVIEEQPIEENSNETIETLVGTNETLSEEILTSNQTISEPEEANETLTEEPNSEIIVIPEIEPVQNLELDVQIEYPEKIIRGGIIEINAIVTNSGNLEIENSITNWELPNEFEIVSGNQTEIFGNLFPGESYAIQISIQTSSSTLLGINEIKLNINY